MASRQAVWQVSSPAPHELRFCDADLTPLPPRLIKLWTTPARAHPGGCPSGGCPGACSPNQASHSPVKMPNEGEEEAAGHGVELVGAGGRSLPGRALPDIRCSHQAQGMASPAERTARCGHGPQASRAGAILSTGRGRSLPGPHPLGFGRPTPVAVNNMWTRPNLPAQTMPFTARAVSWGFLCPCPCSHLKPFSLMSHSHITVGTTSPPSTAQQCRRHPSPTCGGCAGAWLT